jgi:hypothetical protein
MIGTWLPIGIAAILVAFHDLANNDPMLPLCTRYALGVYRTEAV